MKKLLKISGIIAVVAVLFFNLSLNAKSGQKDTDMSALLTMNKADAECCPITSMSTLLGYCLAGECFNNGRDPNCEVTPWCHEEY